MFESIKEVGGILLSEGIVPFDIERIKKGDALAKVIFDLDKGVFDCDTAFACDQKRAEEFLWVGNAIGNKPQLVLTTDNPKYLLDARKKGKWAIGRIIEEIEKRHLDEDKDVKSLYELLCEINEKFFSEGGTLIQKFEEMLKGKGAKVALYTVTAKKGGHTVDLIKEPGYRKFLHSVLYETQQTVMGRCHICGKEKEVLTKPAYPEGTILCLYNIDKSGFISGISRNPENLLRTHAVCIDCKMKLRIGLRYIEKNLRSSIDGLNMFIIPTVLTTQMPFKLLEKLPKFKEAFDVIKSYKKLKDVEEKMKMYKEYIQSIPFIYLLNILFGHRESSHFAYQYLIQNVPETRLIEVGEEFVNTSQRFASILNEELSIGFEEIYRIFPLRKSRTEVEWRPIVELFGAILSGTPYPVEDLITRAVLFARIHRYETYGGYNIKASGRGDAKMCEGLLKYNLLIRALHNIGVIEMKSEEVKGPTVPDKKIEEFLSLQGYNEWQRALFLLGVLVGKIGVEQYKKGDEKKSVLDKIGFEGTSLERVKVLANYVLEGLRNYRILDKYNEALYGCMKELLDRNIGKLQNPIENTFYLLSGYAYITHLTTISGGR